MARNSQLRWFFSRHSLIVIWAVLIALCLGLLTYPTTAQQTSLPSTQLAAPLGQPHEIDWSPDGSMIAWAVGHDIWVYSNTLTLMPNGHLQGHSDEVFSIDWSPDGTQLVSASVDTTIRIWNMQAGVEFGTQKQVFSGHTAAVLRVVWSPDGSKIASLAVDELEYGSEVSHIYNATWIWDVTSGQVTRTFPNYEGSLALAWSPDSLYIANGGEDYREDETTAARIWNVATGELIYRHPTGSYPNNVFRVDWNSTGQYLAVIDQGPLVDIINVNLKNPSLLLRSRVDIGTVDWSPNDSKIATGDVAGHIMIWDTGTAQALVDVAAHDGLVLEVEWNAGGTKLASVSPIDRKLMIWDTTTLPSVAGTSTVTPLPIYATPTSAPTQTTRLENAKIAYTYDAYPAQIYTSSLDGLIQTNFSNSTTAEYQPDWSPDGRSIAFVGYDTGGVTQIFARDTTTQAVSQITDVSGTKFSPVWSPDGQLIAFSKRPPQSGSQSDIFLTKADGTTSQTPYQVTNTTGNDEDPDWSSTNLISFMTYRNGYAQVYVFDVNTRTQRPLLVANVGYNAPRFSPDGQRIAYAKDLGQDVSDIYVVNLATMVEKQLHVTARNISGLDWSPDGSQIAFTSENEEGMGELSVAHANRFGQIRLTNGTNGIYDPSWAYSQEHVSIPCSFNVATSPELIDAINLANTDVTPDTICLEEDYYLLDESGTETGTPNITTAITIKGLNSVQVPNIATYSSYSQRLFYVDTAGSLTLENVAVGGGETLLGGGIYNKGILTLINSTVSSNRALEAGGGIYSIGTLVIRKSKIQYNYVDIYIGGDNGGGIAIAGGTATISGSYIQYNQASRGGGIDVFRGATANITNSVFTSNTAASGPGGAIDNNLATLQIASSLFQYNSATNTVGLPTGGAIASNSNTTVQTTCFLDNTASDGLDVISYPTVHMSAMNNWWGGDGSPSGVGLSGTGETINANVDWSPILINACASTPATETPTPVFNTATNTPIIPTNTPITPTLTPSPTVVAIGAFALANASLTPYITIVPVAGTVTPITFNLAEHGVANVKIVAQTTPSDLSAQGGVVFKVATVTPTGTVPVVATTTPLMALTAPYSYPTALATGKYVIAATPYLNINGTPGQAGRLHLKFLGSRKLTEGIYVGVQRAAPRA